MISTKQKFGTETEHPSKRPRIALNTFGIAFGTAGLAGTWTVAPQQLAAPQAISDILWVAAATVWIVTIARYLHRAGGFTAIRTDLENPVLGPFAALIPTVGSLISARLVEWWPTVAVVGVWAMLAPTTVFGSWFVARLVAVSRDPSNLHGGYLLPTVASVLIAAQSMAAIGQTAVALGYFSVGIFFSAVITTVLIFRLMTGPKLPDPLVPTLAIVSAPPAVAGNAWWAISHGTPSNVNIVLGALMVAMLAPQLFLIRHYVHTAFVLGFWAITFTAASSDTYAVHLLTGESAGARGVALGWLAVLMATVVVGTVAVRSLGIIATGRRHLRALPGAPLSHQGADRLS